MDIPIGEALATFSRAERLATAAALDHIAAKPGPSELGRSMAEIIQLLSAYIRDTVTATP